LVSVSRGKRKAIETARARNGFAGARHCEEKEAFDMAAYLLIALAWLAVLGMMLRDADARKAREESERKRAVNPFA
jgi:hypothetical protein